MTSATMEEQQLSEEQVKRYLIENPGFFINHEQLLADIALPHASGGAVSLLERQVSLLRERNIETRKRLNDLLDQGQRNDVLFNKTKSLILNLLESKQINDLVERLQAYCLAEFQVDAACFSLIATDATHKVSQCQVLAENEVKMKLPSLLASSEAVSGSFREEEFAVLFANAHDVIASAVAMPIKSDGKLIGFLALGSQDAHYFSKSMDAMFLSFIADVVARLLPRYI